MKLALRGGNPVVTADDHVPYPVLAADDKQAVMDVLDSNVLWGNHSPQVKSLEREWAEYVGAKYCIATNSGTAALHIACVAAGIGPGDELIVPTYSFLASATCAMHHNGIPIFVDIKEDTYTIDPSKIEEKISEKTKAIMAVHVHGMPADMDEINAIAAKHGLLVIEDACQAHGALYKGKPTGILGDMAAFSLNASKAIPAGEGGLLTTNDVRLRDTADSTAVFGEILEKDARRAYDARAMGWMYRTQELCAALARSQLKKLDQGNKVRQANAARLSEGLAKIPGISPPFVPDDRTHVYHLYRVSFDPQVINPDMTGKEVRDHLLSALRAEGVDIDLWTGQIPAQTLFQTQEGYGKSCPWSCPHARSGISYELSDYNHTYNILNHSATISAPLHPPNGSALIDKYLEAFNKVFENLDQVWTA
jgi:perosamine synthetase